MKDQDLIFFTATITQRWQSGRSTPMRSPM